MAQPIKQDVSGTVILPSLVFPKETVRQAKATQHRDTQHYNK
jgi:hypothetical protein